MPIAQYSALFSLLGTNFGGDGRVTFGLPDLRGRVPVGAHDSTGPGLTRVRLGEKGGTENTTLTVQNLPSHTHVADIKLRANDGSADDTEPAGNSLAEAREDTYNGDAPNGDMHTGSISATIAPTGNGTQFTNRQPFQGINFIIATMGLFPSRN